MHRWRKLLVVLGLAMLTTVFVAVIAHSPPRFSLSFVGMTNAQMAMFALTNNTREETWSFHYEAERKSGDVNDMKTVATMSDAANVMTSARKLLTMVISV